MSIAGLYNKTVSTKRLATTVGNKQEFTTNISALPCTLHPVENSQQQLNDGSFYETFKIWCDVDADVLTGDRLIDGSDIYTVKAVSRYDFGKNTHLRLTVVRGA